MRLSLVRATFALLAAISIVAVGAGCTDSGVGRQCLAAGASFGSDAGVVGTKIGSPSLECLSRACFQHEATSDNGNNSRLYCTAPCVSDDDCKDGLTSDVASQCPKSQGFVCAIPTQVGDFACQSFCICKDDLVVGVNKDQDTGNVVCPLQCQAEKKCPTGK